MRIAPQNTGIFSTQTNNGFTLAELAIVLLIIGMITGGIVGGRSMIESSRISSTVSQMATYASAHNAFVLKYEGIPGDFKGAEDYGLHMDSDGNINTCRVEWTGTAYYYGNGNGVLSSRYGSIVGHDGEILNYFIHLSNSNLIKETYTREGDNLCNYDHYAGQSYPDTEVDGGLVVLSDYNDTDNNLYFILGGMGVSHNHWLQVTTEEEYRNIAGNYLTPAIAYKLEKKIDNLNPLTGFVKVITAYTLVGATGIGTLTVDATDNSSNCVYNGEYNLSLTDEACTLAVQMRY